MNVRFRSSALEDGFRDYDLATRRWGSQVARRYLLRVQQIQAAAGVADLFALAGARMHPLRGGRSGQYAMMLTGRWRLIVTTESGDIVIEEVSNHYDD